MGVELKLHTGLSAKLSANQTIRPQLQEAISLLQLSTFELLDFVESEAQNNPFIDLPESGDKKHLLSAYPARHSERGEYSKGFDIEQTASRELSLKEHLQKQVAMMRIPAKQRETLHVLIDGLSDDGYLRTPLFAIGGHYNIAMWQLENALQLLQSCDPVGVAARNLPECLAIQLHELDRFDPTMKLLLENLELLAQGRKAELAELAGIDEEQLEQYRQILIRLNPRPAAGFQDIQPMLRAPDVFVWETQAGTLESRLNDTVLGPVSLNQDLLAFAPGGFSSKMAALRSRAIWLGEALEQRRRALTAITQTILEKQHRFFIEGASAMLPFTLREAAKRTGLHESTLSRITRGKFLNCAQGDFELTYFFNPSIPAICGRYHYSSVAVQHHIKELIDKEASDKPASDQQLVKLLREKGINIARRTVTKYRENMKIPSSIERRRLSRLGRV